MPACGGQVRGAPDASSAAADASTECSFSTTGTPQQDGGALYSGTVVASASISGQVLSAGFPSFGGYSTASTGTVCNCITGIALPAPSSSAGTITVLAGPCGPAVGSLAFDSEAGVEAQYTQIPATWTPGDALAVSAQGDPSQVHAFAGILQTGVPIADLSPAIGPSAQNIVIPLDQPLVLSWTPEGRSGETVDLLVREITTTSVVACGCAALDSAGTMTVPSALLSQHLVPTTSKTTAVAYVTRAIETLAGADNAVVQLVGVVETGGPILLE